MGVIAGNMQMGLMERSLIPMKQMHLNLRVGFYPRRIFLKQRFALDPTGRTSESMVRAAHQDTGKINVTAVVTVRNKNNEDIKEAIVKQIDSIADKVGRNIILHLISTHIDPKSKNPVKSKGAVVQHWWKKSKTETANYTAEFTVDSNFGAPGAIMVINKHQQEFFLESVTLQGFASGPIHFPCNSWVQSVKLAPEQRVFFSNVAYLPCETPMGLKAMREEELRLVRGNGRGIRKLSDRIYDFDLYSDLGNPDKFAGLTRPVLGGDTLPYPRRCRTGRPAADRDTEAETRVEEPGRVYVPRDEQFEESKLKTFAGGRLKAVLHNLIPSLMASISAHKNDFKLFAEVDSLYQEGVFLRGDVSLKYDIPMIIARDKFAWLRDDEFARQMIAGVNPVSIERLQGFPPATDSALEESHVANQLHGLSVSEALEENRLFMLDYHDIYLPFLDRINSLEGRKAYATRTVLFLTDLGTLKPVAIEVSLPPGSATRPANRVLTPPVDATTNWLWLLAKAHVCANDAGVHQLVNHWLRTHACLEPFILSAHRQLSSMHPIFKLLDPHMRYTLEINALARQSLINAEGIIESCFTPGPYCMDISAAAYRHWRFDLEALPADLLRRGMAESDPDQPLGIRLILQDYPYASDGLLIWAAIEKWVTKYVNRYYPDPERIRQDYELQAWFSESVNVGHADVRLAHWWPTMAAPADLVSVVTTLIWLASAQHAALNFGQYAYSGYVPNRPPLMRRLIPDENDPEYASFLSDPQKYFLSALPSLLQATKFMAVVDTLSTHSPDEEYLGERQQRSIWSSDTEMVEAFYEFSAEIGRIEKEIEKRNRDRTLRNRCGAGVLPYELLSPWSEPGVTCRGVPNSISI